MKLKKENAQNIILVPLDSGAIAVWRDGKWVGDTNIWPNLYEVMEVATS